ncbi:uncharacterized protein LOC110687335 [Chenopodium quinoa]|uniref:uncharacterized protein LOC110687335 n=1 Tax=Chenopodium quinoa TaxID=63459 RepID=UPI000B7861D8|nr:uncharacterized protein LOC110687335 [Chenopodium quinoa]
MELPLALLGVCPIVLEVSESKGLLSMIQYKKYGDGFEMWTQKEYDVIDSWSKVLSVDFEEPKLLKVLRWRQNGEVLAQTFEGELLSYDPGTKNMITIRDDGMFAAFYACTFTESLVFLEKDCESKRTVRLEEDDTVSNEDENISSLDTIRVRMGKAFVMCNQMMKFRREF